MSEKGKDKNLFQDLTWSDLEQWAGNKTLSRGRDYQRDHRVRDLRKTKEGHLIAWVQGGRRYATQVSSEGRDLKSVCDCPVGRTCKHAVAVVLEYLEYVKKGKSVPPAEAGDGRIEVLENREDEDREKGEYDEYEERAD